MTTALSKDARSYRLTSIDFLRGLVIVVMAIDHVRDFFFAGATPDPMGDADTSLGLYLTRWVTHFCAPVFIFLAGTSAGLMAARKTPQDLGVFLLKRGLWLIFVEVAVISTAWTFAPLGMAQIGGATMVILQVIWAIGMCMFLLGCVQFMGRAFCLYLGIAIVLLHNLLDPLGVGTDLLKEGPLWGLLLFQMSINLGAVLVVEIYPILAWFGVMLVGFGSSYIFEKEPGERNRILMKVGLGLIAGFALLRGLGIYGDPNDWQVSGSGAIATARDFFNVTKYPPSLLFTLITLGPMAVLCAQADRLQGWLKDTLVMFGRVPFAFYIAHLYLIHLLSIGLGMIQGFEVHEFTVLYTFYPAGYGVGLIGVYLVWLLVLVLLYPLCRWMAGIKQRRNDWWLSYL